MRTVSTAARRGTAAHSSAEYLLKTAKRLATYSANKKKGWKENDQGLERPYSAITRWAINRAMAGVPVAPWGVQGYARGLTNWINENVTAIYGCEFSTQHPGGWAGTCDALLGVGVATPEICGSWTGKPAPAVTPRNQSMITSATWLLIRWA